ncbi:MAG: two-component system, OmpR family, response regulator [Blastocatellia bacterium]|jgi:DNA-binding response OmpR family regulator|nr:two-component system, OmpR family, response regulator [Blastocatellia bacterium]
METRQHHVLYIEDHLDTRELVTLVLAKCNYRVTTGSTLADGLNLAREHHFDLYMLDSWLPDGSGIDLCKSLREFDPSTPIMFFSGAAYESDKQTAINSGAQGYIIKPAHLDKLCSEVSKLIGMYPRKREPGEAPVIRNPDVRRASENSAAFELSSTYNPQTANH